MLYVKNYHVGLIFVRYSNICPNLFLFVFSYLFVIFVVNFIIMQFLFLLLFTFISIWHFYCLFWAQGPRVFELNFWPNIGPKMKPISHHISLQEEQASDPKQGPNSKLPKTTSMTAQQHDGPTHFPSPRRNSSA